MGAVASQITSLTIVLLNRLFRRRSKLTSKLRITGLCAGNSQGTGEFPAQMASNAENVSIWWRHHDKTPMHMALWMSKADKTYSTSEKLLTWFMICRIFRDYFVNASIQWETTLHVTSSLIGWSHTQNDPWILIIFLLRSVLPYPTKSLHFQWTGPKDCR